MCKTLRKRLSEIKRVFDIDELMSLQPDCEYIQKYYHVNKIPYSLFHNNSDLVCMGISRDGVYKEEDLFEAARIVDHYVQKFNAKSVLELATGRGTHSFYLAKRYPHATFYGVDISSAQLEKAIQKARKAPNYHPAQGNYHDLFCFPDSNFDVVFVVEALCYSLDKDKVLTEVYRVLRKGGLFIIFDGYRKKTEGLTDEKQLVRDLTEKAMAVTAFHDFEHLKERARHLHFSIEKEEDVSPYVLPTMRRFERLASSFFKFSFLAKLISKVLPKEFTYNAIAGYLMIPLIEACIFSYNILILRKEDAP